MIATLLCPLGTHSVLALLAGAWLAGCLSGEAPEIVVSPEPYALGDELVAHVRHDGPSSIGAISFYPFRASVVRGDRLEVGELAPRQVVILYAAVADREGSEWRELESRVVGAADLESPRLTVSIDPHSPRVDDPITVAVQPAAEGVRIAEVRIAVHRLDRQGGGMGGGGTPTTRVASPDGVVQTFRLHDAFPDVEGIEGLSAGQVVRVEIAVRIDGAERIALYRRELSVGS